MAKKSKTEVKSGKIKSLPIAIQNKLSSNTLKTVSIQGSIKNLKEGEYLKLPKEKEKEKYANDLFRRFKEKLGLEKAEDASYIYIARLEKAK